ncbi:MAG: transporter protein [Patescibacteria group bacterium]|nr:transporter protein [Patescibacteria group bacterium]
MEIGLEPSIVVDHLRVLYNQGKSNETRALEETNISIYPNEYVIIFGPSGCGKSTLLYAIAGLQRPTYGDILINGKGLSKMTEREMLDLHQIGVGLVFQAFYLIESLTILDNVCLPQTFMGERVKIRRAEGIKLLRRFGIAEHADKYPSQLSGGQKQRVAIARSLINNPGIILADEPVGNLDSESAENVLQILKELNEHDGKTIIMVTHNPEHLIYADRVIRMKDGRVISEEVFKEKRKIPEKKKEEEKELLKRLHEEDIPKETEELKMLMASFKNLLPQQVDVLLIPFKAKQLMAHVLSDLSEEQVSMGESFLKELLFHNIDTENFVNSLDKGLEMGGAGWNKSRAETFGERISAVIEQAEIGKTMPSRSPLALAQYLKQHFHITLNPTQDIRLQSTLKLRLESKIGQKELHRRLDAPQDIGGVGIIRLTVEKIVREIEMIMLIKYS